jgi:hypothetical protein
LESDVLFASELSPEDIERELAACGASFDYFCANYFYIFEPRNTAGSPVELEDGEDEQSNFERYLAEKQKQSELTTGELALLYQGIAELRERATRTGRSTEMLFNWWDFQRRAGAWLEWLFDRQIWGMIEKCRDMGMTWLILAFCLWNWLFRPGFQALLGSRKQEAVDNFKLDSLFGKLDYAVSKLPVWMLPAGFVRRKHRTFMSLVNPTNNSFITGDSQTSDFGRSGRYGFVFIDEWDSWDTDVLGSVLNTTNTAVFGGTVMGKRLMWRTRQSAVAISPARVLTMRWYENPKHDQAWYDNMERSMSQRPEIFASEILIDYNASVKGKYYPNAQLVPVRPLSGVDALKWLPQAENPAALAMDYGVRDDCAMIWWQKLSDMEAAKLKPGDPIHRMMFCYANSGKGIEFYLPFIKVEHPDRCVPMRDEYTKQVITDPRTGEIVYKKLTKLYDYSEKDYDFIQRLRAAGVNWQSLAFRGDPAGRQRNQVTATSVEQVLVLEGLYFESFPGKPNSYVFRRAALSSVLGRTEASIEADSALDALRQAKYPEKKENGGASQPSDGPVHDWTSHYRSAAEYYAIPFAPEPKEDEKPAAGSMALFGVARGSSSSSSSPGANFGIGMGVRRGGGSGNNFRKR